MMADLKMTMKCLYSPTLYNIYGEQGGYSPNKQELIGDNLVKLVSKIWNVGLYTAPLLCIYMYKNGMFTPEHQIGFAKVLGGIGCFVAASMILRSYGRASNPSYRRFMNDFEAPKKDINLYLSNLRKYDFDFKNWPVSFYAGAPGTQAKVTFNRDISEQSTASTTQEHRSRFPLNILAYIATHTFALRLIFPGSLGIIQALVGPALQQGRQILVNKYHGKRAKLSTIEGNSIDTMFVDNRRNHPQGKIAVICCEGNSGFYEIGIMTTPIKAGYSAIGWNHPGFASSTGKPLPEQEQNAINAVMLYARSLGFTSENTVLFGWSIGGYAATWAAVNYPNVRALVLDATFDDLLPLATAQMPGALGPLVKEVIRSYVNLNIAEMVLEYPGPVVLVRRTEDEIISLTPEDISTNRGNHLLISLMKHRHPEVLGQEIILGEFLSLRSDQRDEFLKNNYQLDSKTLRTLKLVSQYLLDYDSSHCTPLPEDMFQSSLECLPNVVTVK